MINTTYPVLWSSLAEEDFENIKIYLREYSAALALKHATRLVNALLQISLSPTTWSYFFITGHPYRARLFSIGSATYWIVYRIDEANKTVRLLRIWDSRQSPEGFEF